jgi:hypothetical protein
MQLPPPELPRPLGAGDPADLIRRFERVLHTVPKRRPALWLALAPDDAAAHWVLSQTGRRLWARVILAPRARVSVLWVWGSPPRLGLEPFPLQSRSQS